MNLDSLLELPFDQYQRYRLIQRAADRLRDRRERLKILDVGGHAFTVDGSASLLPIRLFLPEDDTVVLDIHAFNSRGYLRGSGAAVPFIADSFDVVVSCDTLEHVVPGERRGFLAELLRVSREYMVLIAPVHQPETLLADRILDVYISRTLGVTHQALREHLIMGLPRLEQVRGFLDEANASYVDFPSGYVYHWLIMMMAKHYLISIPDTVEMHRTLDLFYNRHLSESDERAPAYRHVFVVSKHGLRQPLLDIKNDHDILSRRRSQADDVQGPGFFDLLMSFLQLQREMGPERDLREQIIDKELRISQLEIAAADKDYQIAELRRIINEYHQQLTDSQSKLQQTEFSLAEYAKSMEEAKELLQTYHENLMAAMANLEATQGALGQTSETLERFKKGRVVSTMMKTQELIRRLRGSRTEPTSIT